MSRKAEVEFGESQEAAVLAEWLAAGGLSGAALSRAGVARWTDAVKFADNDFCGWRRDGLPIVFLEVKVRRSLWGAWGKDVMFPLRKHDFATHLAGMHIRFLGVTRYSCGTLVEVDLATAPDSSRVVVRRDRPGTPGVLHGLWTDGLLVYTPEGSA